MVPDGLDADWIRALIRRLAVPHSSVIEHKELARGSTGIVKKGLWNNLPVCIKRLLVLSDLELYSPSEEAIQYQLLIFEREVAVLSSYPHPNVVQILAVLTVEDRVHGMVTEFASGGALGTYLSRLARRTGARRGPGAGCGCVDWVFLVRVMRDVAHGLAHLHSKGILHRDLKDDNVLVFLTAEGAYVCAKVADVGLAKPLSDKDSYGGNMFTMAPERLPVADKPPGSPDPRSDVYSFGIMFASLILQFMTCGEDILVEEGRSHTFYNRDAMLLRALRRLETAAAPAELAAILRACVAEAGERISSQDLVSRLLDVDCPAVVTWEATLEAHDAELGRVHAEMATAAAVHRAELAQRDAELSRREEALTAAAAAHQAQIARGAAELTALAVTHQTELTRREEELSEAHRATVAEREAEFARRQEELVTAHLAALATQEGERRRLEDALTAAMAGHQAALAKRDAELARREEELTAAHTAALEQRDAEFTLREQTLVSAHQAALDQRDEELRRLLEEQAAATSAHQAELSRRAEEQAAVTTAHQAELRRRETDLETASRERTALLEERGRAVAQALVTARERAIHDLEAAQAQLDSMLLGAGLSATQRSRDDAAAHSVRAPSHVLQCEAIPEGCLPCEAGVGLAVSSSLGMVAMSHQKLNAVSVYRITGAGAGGAGAGDGPLGTPTAQALRLQHHCTIDNSTSGVFDSLDFSRTSGWLAFLEAGGATAPLLLVSDSIKGSVHMFDVHSGQHAGYLVAPGGLPGARGVAVSPDCGTIAVSACAPGTQVSISLYAARGDHGLLRTIQCGAGRARGLAFSADGLVLAVVDDFHRCLTGYNVETGESVGCIAADLSDPRDVGPHGGGWLVPTFNGNGITWVGQDGRSRLVLNTAGVPYFPEPLSVATLAGPEPGSEMLAVRSKSGLALFRLRRVLVTW